MKIQSNRPIARPERKQAVKSEKTSSFTPTAAPESSRAASTATPASAVNSVDALLALQGQADDRSPEERASRRAFSLLDILDEIKIGLLEGGIPALKLRQLVRALGSERAATGDVRLEGLLDEVETRALVELAKHESALS